MANNQQREIIIQKLKKEDVFFKDNFNNGWVLYDAGNHKEIYPIKSGNYNHRIYTQFSKHFNENINMNEVESVAKILEAYAIMECKEKMLSLRVAEKNGRFYYDLTNELHEIVEITENGWKIVENNKIFFKRYNHHKSQVTPADTRETNLNHIGKYFNVPSDKGLLFTVYLISCFIPKIQHPIMILHGESGQGKTTICRWVKELVDPCEYSVMSISQSEDDFFMTMDQNWMTAFDNLSGISERISDNLCKIVTGTALQRRKHYSQDELVTWTPNNCVVLNGIENIATKEDLLSRSLIFQVNRGKKSVRPMAELTSEFESEKSLILGSTFNILAKAKKIYPTIKIPPEFRMAEFAKWGYAIAEAMGGMGDKFIRLYKENIELQESEAISENTLICAIIYLMKTRRTWKGRASDLFYQVQKIARTYALNMHSTTMPQSEAVLTKKLKAQCSLLKRAGIQFNHRRVGIGSEITLQKIE